MELISHQPHSIVRLAFQCQLEPIEKILCLPQIRSQRFAAYIQLFAQGLYLCVAVVLQEIFDQEPHPASGILRNVGICLQEDGLELIQVLHFQAVAFSPLVQDLRTVGLQLLIQFLQQPPHGFCAQAHLLREFIHRFIFVLRYQA